MATTLYLVDETEGDVHLGLNMPRLRDGAGAQWYAGKARETRGTSVATHSASSVAGPTSGVEEPLIDGDTLGSFISEAIDRDVTISGTITVNLWGFVSAAANAAINIVIQKIPRDNNDATGEIVEIARSTHTADLTTSSAVYNFNVTPTSTALNRGDRLRFVVFFDDSVAGDMITARTLSFRYNGATGAADGDSFVTFTETFSRETDAAGSILYFTEVSAGIDPGSANELEAWTSRGSGVQSAVTNTQTGWVAPIQITATAGGTLVEWYSKRLEAFTLGGRCDFNVRALESAGTANASLRAEVAVCDADGSNATVLGSMPMQNSTGFGNGELPLSETAFDCIVGVDDTAIAAGRRLRFRIYVNNQGNRAMASGQTVTFFYAGTSGGASGDSFVQLPQTVTEYEAVTGYQRLVGPVQLAAAAADLYVVPPGSKVEIRSVHLNNPSGSEREVTLSIGNDAGATRFLDQLPVEAGGSVHGRRFTNHSLEAGEKIQGFCDSASTVVLVIDGYVTSL